MSYEVNECCMCAVPGYPCIGNDCHLKHVIRYQCDDCGVDDLSSDEVHETDEGDLCDDCYKQLYSDEEDFED